MLEQSSNRFFQHNSYKLPHYCRLLFRQLGTRQTVRCYHSDLYRQNIEAFQLTRYSKLWPVVWNYTIYLQVSFCYLPRNEYSVTSHHHHTMASQMAKPNQQLKLLRLHWRKLQKGKKLYGKPFLDERESHRWPYNAWHETNMYFGAYCPSITKTSGVIDKKKETYAKDKSCYDWQAKYLHYNWETPSGSN